MRGDLATGLETQDLQELSFGPSVHAVEQASAAGLSRFARGSLAHVSSYSGTPPRLSEVLESPAVGSLKTLKGVVVDVADSLRAHPELTRFALMSTDPFDVAAALPSLVELEVDADFDFTQLARLQHLRSLVVGQVHRGDVATLGDGIAKLHALRMGVVSRRRREDYSFLRAATGLRVLDLVVGRKEAPVLDGLRLDNVELLTLRVHRGARVPLIDAPKVRHLSVVSYEEPIVADVAKLACLPSLDSLTLFTMGLSQSDLLALAKARMHRLRHFTIEIGGMDTDVDEASEKLIRSLPQIEELRLGYHAPRAWSALRDPERCFDLGAISIDADLPEWFARSERVSRVRALSFRKSDRDCTNALLRSPALKNLELIVTNGDRASDEALFRRFGHRVSLRRSVFGPMPEPEGDPYWRP